jgi:hypothetical protein
MERPHLAEKRADIGLRHDEVTHDHRGAPVSDQANCFGSVCGRAHLRTCSGQRERIQDAGILVIVQKEHAHAQERLIHAETE